MHPPRHQREVARLQAEVAAVQREQREALARAAEAAIAEAEVGACRIHCNRDTTGAVA